MKVSGELHASVALPREKRFPYPPNRRLGGPQTQYRRFEEQKSVGSAGDQITIPQFSGRQPDTKCVKNYRKILRQFDTRMRSWEDDIKMHFEMNQPPTQRLPGFFPT